MNLPETQIQCPYCWEILTIIVDASVDEQSYVEDCQVCCSPILLHVVADQGEVVAVDAVRENE